MDLSIRIVHLATGEQVVTKIQEVKDGDEVQCFNFVMPMTLSMKIPKEDSGEKPLVSLYPFSPFSVETEWRIGFDQVVAIGRCSPIILNKYVDTVQPLYPILDQKTLELYIKERTKNNE